MKNRKIEIPFTNLILTGLFAWFVSMYFGETMSFWLNFTFLINGVAILLTLFAAVKRRAFSFEMVHGIFLGLFLWVAPVIQRVLKVSLWGVRLSDTECIWANLLIFCWICAFALGQKLGKDKSFKVIRKSVNMPDWVYYAMFALTVGITLFMIYGQGIDGLIDEGGSIFAPFTESQTLIMLGEKVVTGVVLVSCLFIIRRWRADKKWWIVLVLLCLVCLVLTHFPTAISRYAAGSIYLCILMNIFSVSKKKPLFFWVFSLAMIFMFPVFDLYRYVSLGNVSFGEIVKQLFSVERYFASGNYDAYTVICACFRYLVNCGHTLGRQLIGSFIFFIPRAIWPDKPVSSGMEIAHSLGFTFDNISAPLPMEMFIDFGIIGMIILGVAVGYFLRKVDNSYWQNEDPKRNSYIDIVYCYAVPFFLFLCRGSLLSTWANLSAILAVAVIPMLFCWLLGRFGYKKK